MNGKAQLVVHPLPPVADAHSRVLILGTMPSPKSREYGFYYAHPQNRFWPVLAAVVGEPVPLGSDARRQMALRHGVALWDVLRSCTIRGADDSTIRDPVPNDIASLLARAPVNAIFTNGQKSTALYNKFCYPVLKRPSIPLPSTSAANRGAYPMERLLQVYTEKLLPYLGLRL